MDKIPPSHHPTPQSSHGEHKSSPCALRPKPISDSTLASNSTDELARITKPNPPRLQRSCKSCRERKVKCDREQPCSHCMRCKIECIYPPGPGRAVKRRRNTSTLSSQVINKLYSLEQVIKRLTADGGEVGLAPDTPYQDLPAPLPLIQDPNRSKVGPKTFKVVDWSSTEQQFGRLTVQGTRSHYISNILWANLSNEVCNYFIKK